MKKNLMLILLITSFLAITSFLNLSCTQQGDTQGQPFKALQQQVDELKQQIEEICPKIEGKIVFLTSTKHTGDLGGVEGADAICQGLAEAVGLSGTFKAWIGNDISDPFSSFTHSDVPYVLVNGSVVAYNWTDLTDGGWLRNSIVFDESGNYKGGQVWTGTSRLGLAEKLNDCREWSYGGINASGRGGKSTCDQFTCSDEWTIQFQDVCKSQRRLYCFEQ